MFSVMILSDDGQPREIINITAYAGITPPAQNPLPSAVSNEEQRSAQL